MKNAQEFTNWFKDVKTNFDEIGTLTTKFVTELSGEDKEPFSKWLGQQKIFVAALTIPIIGFTYMLCSGFISTIDPIDVNNKIKGLKLLQYIAEVFTSNFYLSIST